MAEAPLGKVELVEGAHRNHRGYWLSPSSWAEAFVPKWMREFAYDCMRDPDEDYGAVGEKDGKKGYKIKQAPLPFASTYKRYMEKLKQERAEPPAQLAQQPQQQGESDFPEIEKARFQLLTDRRLRRYDLREAFEKVEADVRRKGYFIEYGKSLGELEGHPESRRGNVVYIANDTELDQYGTHAVLLAHHLGHYSYERQGIDPSEKQVDEWAKEYLAGKFGEGILAETMQKLVNLHAWEDELAA